MIPSEAAQRSNVPQLQFGWWTATTSYCIRNYSTDYRQLLLAFFFLFLFFLFFPWAKLRGYFILFDIFWTDVFLQMSGPWQLPANISLQWLYHMHMYHIKTSTHTKVQKYEMAKAVTKEKKSVKSWKDKGCVNSLSHSHKLE